MWRGGQIKLCCCFCLDRTRGGAAEHHLAGVWHQRGSDREAPPDARSTDGWSPRPEPHPATHKDTTHRDHREAVHYIEDWPQDSQDHKGYRESEGGDHSAPREWRRSYQSSEESQTIRRSAAWAATVSFSGRRMLTLIPVMLPYTQ